MLADPFGKLLQMHAVLPFFPVPNYFLPGLFLFIVIGLTSLLLLYALFTRPYWPLLSSLFKWNRYYWAWTGMLVTVIFLATWLFLQALLMGFRWPIQYITAADGLMVLFFLLSPVTTQR